MCRFRPFVLLMMLAACNGASDPAESCGADDYATLIGTPLAAVTLPADLNDRVLRPGDAATTDFDPTRLNIALDADGVITGLSCG